MIIGDIYNSFFFAPYLVTFSCNGPNHIEDVNVIYKDIGDLYNCCFAPYLLTFHGNELNHIKNKKKKEHFPTFIDIIEKFNRYTWLFTKSYKLVTRDII